MAEFQVTPKRVVTPKPKQSVCGDCGEPISKSQLLCKECAENIAIASSQLVAV